MGPEDDETIEEPPVLVERQVRWAMLKWTDYAGIRRRAGRRRIVKLTVEQAEDFDAKGATVDVDAVLRFPETRTPPAKAGDPEQNAADGSKTGRRRGQKRVEQSAGKGDPKPDDPKRSISEIFDSVKGRKAEPIEVPAGKVSDVLAWVGEPGDDHDLVRARAEAALVAELERDEDDRRSTLLEPLHEILGDDATGDESGDAGDGSEPAGDGDNGGEDPAEQPQPADVPQPE